MTQNAAGFDPADDEVFSRIAHQYDFLCDVFSLYAHRLWKRRMALVLSRLAGSVFLDVASGTGDIAIRVAHRLNKQPIPGVSRKIIASDICPAMLDLAKKKAANVAGNFSFAIFDAHNLEEIADNSVDIYSISFAMKICDRERVLPEALRVLKPGGTFACLEASRIPVSWINNAYLRYMEWCIPKIAVMATRGDKSAYDYLTRGIREMPDQGSFQKELESVGFEDVHYENLSFGIVALHCAQKPR